VPRAAVAAIPLVLIPALGAAQGGFSPDAWVWSGTIAAWLAALGLFLGDSARLRRDVWWVLAAASLLAWTLASAVWSAEPGQSVLEARRMLVYAAIVLALVVLARRRSSTLLLAATHAGVAALVLYALARYLIGSRTNLEFEGHLLTEPLGYANAIGILAAMAIILSLARAAQADSPPLRAAAGALVPPLSLALFLTGSHASWLALAIGLATMAALTAERWALRRTVAALAPAATVAVAFGQFSKLATPSTPRVGGLVVALVAVVCAAAGALTLRLWPPRRTAPSPPQAPVSRRLAFAGVLAIAGATALTVALGGSNEPRASYYHVAWHEFAAHPLLGSGAGTFGHYWLGSGRVAAWGGALDAHSLYLETLAELGPIGLCLLAVFLFYPLKRAIGGRALGPVPAAAGAATAFLVHAGVDWDWELPAVVIAGLACAAVVAFADATDDEKADRPAGPALRAAALIAALVAGAAAIAGTRSTTEPSAGPVTAEAPQNGASAQSRSLEGQRYLPL
jgi:O-Antigen ligase